MLHPLTTYAWPSYDKGCIYRARARRESPNYSSPPPQQTPLLRVSRAGRAPHTLTYCPPPSLGLHRLLGGAYRCAPQAACPRRGTGVAAARDGRG